VLSGGGMREVDATVGQSAMRAATANGVPGIIAECGGYLSCGTCHVYVAGEWADRLPPPAWDEEDMLQIVVAPTPTSRMSCQIVITPELDGLTLEVPARQL
jgi:ferredoxin, 2Fe-2S